MVLFMTIVTAAKRKRGENMPKKITRPKDKYKHFVIERIEHECDLRGISNEHQRLIAMKSQSAYDIRRKDPGKFTFDELLRFSRKLRIPIWELLKPDSNYAETMK